MKRYLILISLLALAFSATASTVEQAAAAGARAMTRFDATTKLWLRTQPATTQQLVLCSSLEAMRDEDGLVALDCVRAASTLTPAKAEAIAASLRRYYAGFGYAYPTANDVAQAPPSDRAAIHQAIACQRIRDRIAVQADLMRRGSTGYWNMTQMQVVERQKCGDNMAVLP